MALTQEAYGYVGGNPLNFTDPSGLIRGVITVSFDPCMGQRCPFGTKGAAGFLGWRFAISALDKFFLERDLDGALDALTGGWGTATTTATDKAGNWANTPMGRYSAGPSGSLKWLGQAGKVAGKVTGAIVGLPATLIDYACDWLDRS